MFKKRGVIFTSSQASGFPYELIELRQMIAHGFAYDLAQLLIEK